MSGFLWGMLTLGNFILFIIVAIFSTSNSKERKQMMADSLPEDKIPSVNRRRALVNEWVKAISTIRPEKETNCFTSQCLGKLQMNWEVREKAMIRKEVSFRFKDPKERKTTAPEMNAEHLVTICENIPGVYREKIFDKHTGKLIEKRKLKYVDLKVCYSQVPKPLAAGSCCPDCRITPVASRNQFYCPSCGKTFGTQETEWVLSKVEIIENKSNNPILKPLTSVLTLATLAPFVLSFMANKKPVFMNITIGFNLLLGALSVMILLIGLFLRKRKKKVGEIISVAEAPELIDYASHITDLLFLLKEDKPEAAVPLLSPTAWKDWKDEYYQNGSHVLECCSAFDTYSIVKAETIGNENYISMGGEAAIRFLNKDRKVEEIKKKIHLKLYRNVNYFKGSVFQCGACGKPTHLTDSGVCTACRAPYDMSYIRYRTARINNEAFFEWGGDIYGTY